MTALPDPKPSTLNHTFSPMTKNIQNLIKDAWIPIQRKNGELDIIAPWQITEQFGTDQAIATISSPRPDFDVALIQFLIALLQTTMTAKNQNDWFDLLEEPLAPDLLKQQFLKVANAFEVKGEGACFMQDFDFLEVKSPNVISNLLIDAPGSNTIKENKDHFVKRGKINAICPACAVTALFTLQINAPSGGQGHRTSLRGGGPLTSLVVNDPKNSGLAETLWVNLWLNVLDKSREKKIEGNWNSKTDSDIFPWLTTTFTSEKTTGKEIFPQDTHPDQMYWSMPRRIRLLWDQSETGHCDLCDHYSAALVTQYESKKHGMNYAGEWQHPLSPHSINKDGMIIPRHAQPDGLSYRHWLDFIEKTKVFSPAMVVQRYKGVIASFKPHEKEQLRLHVFGYDMDKMTAKCWYESTFPLYELKNSNAVDLSLQIEMLTSSAIEVAGFVSTSIKNAWFRRPKDAKGDTSFLKQAFFQSTEQNFYRLVEQLRETDGSYKENKVILNKWHRVLRENAYRLFDYWSDNGDFAQSDPEHSQSAYKTRAFITQ